MKGLWEGKIRISSFFFWGVLIILNHQSSEKEISLGLVFISKSEIITMIPGGDKGDKLIPVNIRI